MLSFDEASMSVGRSEHSWSESISSLKLSLASASASETTRPICKIPESVSGLLSVRDMVKRYEKAKLSKLVEALLINKDVGYLDRKTKVLKRQGKGK